MFKHNIKLVSKEDNPRISISLQFLAEDKEYEPDVMQIFIANELRKRRIMAFADTLETDFITLPISVKPENDKSDTTNKLNFKLNLGANNATTQETPDSAPETEK